jgi:hypothetical protein
MSRIIVPHGKNITNTQYIEQNIMIVHIQPQTKKEILVPFTKLAAGKFLTTGNQQRVGIMIIGNVNLQLTHTSTYPNKNLNILWKNSMTEQSLGVTEPPANTIHG